jgi:hypothetical protein
MDVRDGSNEADLICSIKYVDRWGVGLGVPLTYSNEHIDGIDVGEGFQDAELICSIEHVDGQGVG